MVHILDVFKVSRKNHHETTIFGEYVVFSNHKKQANLRKRQELSQSCFKGWFGGHLSCDQNSWIFFPVPIESTGLVDLPPFIGWFCMVNVGPECRRCFVYVAHLVVSELPYEIVNFQQNK